METLRKRLLYKATHRGMQETDKIIGGFAQQELAGLNAEMLADLDRLLDVPDIDLLNWIMGRDALPEAHNNPLFEAIIEFKESL